VQFLLKRKRQSSDNSKRKSFIGDCLMFKIGRIPRSLESFFRPLLASFLWDQATYFQSLVLVMAFAWGRRNITNLYRFLDVKRHRTRFNNFLHRARVDLAELLRQKATELVDMARCLGEKTAYLIIDDTRKPKRGKYMAGVGYIYDDVLGRTIPGHLYVTAIIRIGPVVIPLGIRLYVKKEQCEELGLEFRRMTELAAELIRLFEAPKGMNVHVVFDSFYLCPRVVWACEEKGFHFVSTLKDNRTVFMRGRNLKLGVYKKRAFRTGKKKTVKLRKPNGELVKYSYVDLGWVDIKRLGKVRVVLSRKNSERKILAIATNDPNLSGESSIRSYAQRPSIEQFFKDTKQLLGLGQYQNRSYEAAVRHLQLVMFSYALLTHLRLAKARGAKGKRKKREVAGMSVFEAQVELRHVVWKDLVKYLEDFQDPKEVLKELRRLLVAA